MPSHDAVSRRLELVRRYGATHTSEQFAGRLNAAGLLTGKGKPFTAGAVAPVGDAYKIWFAPCHPRQ
jgi:hypothetical protein